MSRHLSPYRLAIPWVAALVSLLGIMVGIVGFPSLASAAKLPEWMRTLDVEEGLAAFPDAEIVGMLESTTLEVEKSGKRTYRVRSAYHVRSGQGTGYETTGIRENYWQKLKGLKAWRRNAAGVVESFDEILTTQAAGGELYSDARESRLLIPDIEAGDLFGFELRFEQHLPEMSTHRAMVRRRIPLLRGEFSLDLPDDWTFEGIWYDPVEDRLLPLGPSLLIDRRRIWIWSSLDGFADPEPFEPPDTRLIPWFAVRYHDPSGRAATMVDWKSVSDWGHSFSASALEDHAQLEPVAREIVGDARDAGDQIERIAEFVRSSIGYVQIYLGDGGWRPHRADVVYQNRFGDCKDMAHLAIALLQSLDVEAYPVWTSTEDGMVWPDFPDDPFNHCIVAVDDPNEAGRFLFFDPTAKAVPFGRLPAFLEGAWALVLSSSVDSTLVRMPTSRADANLQNFHISAIISSDLSCVGVVEATLTGQRAFVHRKLRGSDSTEEHRLRHEERLGQQFPGARVTNISYSGLEEVSDSVQFRYEFAIPRYARKVGRLTLVSPDFMTAHSREFFPAVERKTSIVIAYPYRTETTVELTLPSGWMPAELPEDVMVQNHFGRFARNCTVDAGKILITRAEQLNQVELPPAEYELAREWSRAAYMADREKITLGRP